MNSSGLVSFERFWGLCKRQLDMDYVYYIYFNSTRIRAICKIWGGFVNPFLRERLSNFPRTHPYCDPKVSLSIFRKTCFEKFYWRFMGIIFNLRARVDFVYFFDCSVMFCFVFFLNVCCTVWKICASGRTLVWLIEKRRKTFSNF